MSIPVSLPNKLYEQAKQTAERNQQSVDEYVAELVSQAVAAHEEIPLVGDEALDQEAKAWYALHPQLREKYSGQYVALYQGEVVDVDADLLTISRRIRRKYGNETVWISRVEEKPFREIHMRSPRIER